MAPFLRRAVAPVQMAGRLVRAPLRWRPHASRQCVPAVLSGGGGAPFSTDGAKKQADPLESLPAVVRENCVGMGQVSRRCTAGSTSIAPGYVVSGTSERAGGRRWSSAIASTRAR